MGTGGGDRLVGGLRTDDGDVDMALLVAEKQDARRAIVPFMTACYFGGAPTRQSQPTILSVHHDGITEPCL